ncbi:glycosyltransferase family 4 protein [Janibacter corallicola]|uniref:glycosyltransferase family 4 protein n=1 Tax=Janibacter corallicola TaxID=415212 RepID=UPI0008327EB0|nr:glycosyltransferase family 4 protein [Janibacter corallicola]
MTRSTSTRADGLRVLYLSWRDRENPEAGGAETFTERTSEVLTQLGHHVTLFTAAFPGASPRTRHGDVDVVRRGSRFGVYLHGLWHVLRHGRDYDVILDVQNGVPFWAPLVTRTPVVNVVHHVHRDQWKVVFGPFLSRLGWFLESRVAPAVYRDSRYVTVSKSTRDELAGLGVDPERVDLVYSGNDRPEDLDRYTALPRTDTPSMLFLGRLVPHKHVEQAIDVLATRSRTHPDMELHVVGGGYWESALAEHAAARGVADRVHLHGFVEESVKHELLSRAWVVVMPSHKEGWGLTIVEAGLHGTPAVAYRFAGGPSESIVHGRTGLLADSPEEFEEHVVRLLDDAVLRRSMGRTARLYASSFDWVRTGRRLAKVIHSVLGHGERCRDDVIDLDALISGPPEASHPEEPPALEEAMAS